MCCWPFSDVFLEQTPGDRKRSAQKQSVEPIMLVQPFPAYNDGGYFGHPGTYIPPVTYTPLPQAPGVGWTYLGGQQPTPVPPAQFQPVLPSINNFPPPPVPQQLHNSGVYYGPSRQEHLANIVARCAKDEPQELKPSDPDKNKFYAVREPDGNWCRRNRYVIESGDIGKVRWFQRPNGTFYAHRLPQQGET